MSRSLDVATSWASSVAELGAGLTVRRDRLGPRPVEHLRLYEFEACPWCRRVRETLSELDLEARIHPCPRGGRRFRPWVIENGGKRMFPYLVDPNTGDEMYESTDIIRHLYRHYGRGMPSRLRLINAVDGVRSSLAGVGRVTRGRRARTSREPEEALHLWSFEASPYCRIVREALCELELPYVLHNVAKNSPSRRAFVERSGKMMVPYLWDPNEGVEMFESADIVAHLQRTYAT